MPLRHTQRCFLADPKLHQAKNLDQRGLSSIAFYKPLLLYTWYQGVLCSHRPLVVLMKNYMKLSAGSSLPSNSLPSSLS